jgi:ATP-binding cassette subfamily B (MDR/TAP) protein 1
MFLISIISHSINGFLSEYLVYEFRSNIYLNILRQDLGFFDKSENSVGVLTTRLSSDVQCLQALTIDRLNLILFGLVSVLIGIVIGFYYDWRLTLVIFSLTPLLGIIGSLQVKLSSFGADEVKKGYESITSKSLEYISHIKTIKAFTREEQSLKEFASDIDEYLKKERKMGFLSGLGSSLMVLFSYAMYAFIYYIGAVFLQKGWITFEGILKVSNGVMVVVIGLAQISQISADSGKSKLSLNAIYELLDFKSSIDGIDDSNGLKPEIEDQDIVFSNVSFAYPSRTKVKILEDFNLRIQAKKSTGIVGTSGCGKSTILALIQRLYECDGNILLGETNIRDLNVKHLRSKIGVVSQEPVLFEGTIRENILYGNPLASEDELKSAIEQSNVSAFIDTLDFTDNGVSYRGLDANIGSKGVQLSVGQKQRVAIARAIIKNPEILLLDEATSALDSESEYEVQEALKKAMKGRTTIMISHRLSTMKDADQIIVMDAGKIAEQGNHEELVELNGLYANLCRIGNSMK